MCATPSMTVFLTFLRGACLALEFIYRLPVKYQRYKSDVATLAVRKSKRLFADRFARTFTGTCVGLGALAADRQATAMTQAAIATQIQQALDVHGDLATQVAFDGQLADLGAQQVELLLVQRADFGRLCNASFGAQCSGAGAANAVDVRQRDDGMFVVRDVDAGDTGHSLHSTHRSTFTVAETCFA